MTLRTYLLPFLALALIGCGQQAAKPPASPVQALNVATTPSASDIPVNKPVAAPQADVMTLVQALAHDPTLLTKSWSQMSARFPGCKKPNDENDLICPPMTGLKLASVQDGGLGIIDLEFTFPVTCDIVYQAVQAELGRGEVGADKCDVRWKLAPKVKGGYATISNDPKAPERIFFQLAIEQGP